MKRRKMTGKTVTYRDWRAALYPFDFSPNCFLCLTMHATHACKLEGHRALTIDAMRAGLDGFYRAADTTAWLRENFTKFLAIRKKFDKFFKESED